MKERLRQIAVPVTAVGTSIFTGFSVFAADPLTDPSAVISAAATSVGSQATSALGAVAPIAMGLGGLFLVYKLGWKFFKGLAK